MKIQKRNGEFEKLSFDKIITRLKKLANDKNLGKLSTIDTDIIAQKVVSSIYDGVKSQELDDEAARIAITMIENSEYPQLASRIVISSLHKNTINSFSQVMDLLYEHYDINNNFSPILSQRFINLVRKYSKELDEMIDYSRDYLFDYFGLKTLEKSYLMKKDNQIVERPQHLYMRVCVNVLGDNNGNLDLEKVKTMYDLMSEHYFTMASPVLFNSGSPLNNLISCVLMGTDDSIEGIFKTISDCASVSKVGSGIGLHISNIRAKNSVIRGTNGKSDGIIPMIKVYNSVCSYVNQCLLPGTRVYSKDGLKSVEKITTNDYLLTSDGSFKRVNQVMITDADVQEINWKQKKIKKQKVLAKIEKELTDRGNQVTDEILEIEFRRREHDEEQRLLRRQIHEFYTGAYWKPLQCTSEHEIYIIPATKQTGYFKTRHQIRHKIKKPVFVSAREIKVHDLMGYPIPREIIDFDISEEQCYQSGLECHFEDIPKYMNLPEKKYYAILSGLFNGSHFEEKINAFYFKHQNTEIIDLIRYLLMRLEVLPTYDSPYQIRFPKLEKYKKLNIYNNFTHQKRNNTYFKHDNFLWTKIKKIDKIKYTGKVYDFNMKDNHNYLTEHGLVHNSGRRKGSIAIYIEPYHADILEFLDLKRNQGHEDVRARDLFYAIWAPDLFMKQVETDGDWYLMCPDECPGLSEVYGEEFENLYWKYVSENKYKSKIKAQDVWKKMLDSQIETGVPYLAYKDSANKKSNQKNIGTIKSSNLCMEILEVSDKDNHASCNLSSIALAKFVKYNKSGPYFDHDHLYRVAKFIIHPMNKVIDNTYYPTEEMARSNKLNRPLAIGVQALSDTFIKMRYPYDSPEAEQLNKEIFETLYYGCVQGSIEEAKIHGSYSNFQSSPTSEGKLQFDLWEECDPDVSIMHSGRWDWNSLKQDLKTYGIRNSLLTGLMPTASTAILMGNTESFELMDSCIFKRRVLAGEFMVVNKYLVDDLNKLGLWNKDIKDLIIANSGSIQGLDVIPIELQNLYKTVWEISMKTFINYAADRSIYIDQSQSMNLFMKSPTHKKLSSMLLYGYKKHLKTGLYYLRSQAQTSAGKFTIDPDLEKRIKEKQQQGKKLTKKEETIICSIENKEACEMCSS